MPPIKLNILITGCSAGGIGAALAIAFHKAGHRVFATARDVSKLSNLAALGIGTVAMDVTSAPSIESAFSIVSSSLPTGSGLDMLINNAGAVYKMPLTDVSLAAAKELFDVNVWAPIAVVQAFAPLLLRSSAAARSAGRPRPLVVNHTSTAAVVVLPFQGVYNSSKAALAMLTDTLRLELEPLGIGVVELKSGAVRTNIFANSNVGAGGEVLPAATLFAPARDVVERAMAQEFSARMGVPVDQWAAEVSALLLARNPPAVIWKGGKALLARLSTVLPHGLFDGYVKKLVGLDVVAKRFRDGGN